MTLIDKVRILESYFEKSITKKELKLLLKLGIVCTPIPWINESPEDKMKRELVSRIFGKSNINILWV